ncbi:EAL domain-containing protein [Terrihabitans sp. PJ23]|uniref:EAL domain-containing protein n=1 Tax=Terrihabitans rhizophilus TaxID=3092662 RepID=A0ABU4RR74_9HYPH|nr:EAL domain-containing protein [Terrihabitans sp. PJ23]
MLDGIILLASTTCLFALAAHFDFAERLEDFIQDHESWQLDEIFLLAGFLSLATLIFAFRRIQDQRVEIRLRNEAESAARNLALLDPLTGLPNRRHLGEVLDNAMLQGPADGRCHAVLLIDLNGFKRVNDGFGHPAGDELLVSLSKRLSGLFKEGTFLARLGGDEFALIAFDLSGLDAATAVVRKVAMAFEEPFFAAGSEHIIGASIGIALAPQDGTLGADLLRRADIALYRSKESGGSSSCFFEESMDDLVLQRITMERDLRHAIVSGDVLSHYQPIVNLKTQQIVGFEALARWTHPTKGNMPPDRFIPIAEDTALIRDLTESLLRRACRDALEWPDHIVLSVNLSAVLLRDRTMGLRVLAILAETGLNPARLAIEITESSLVSDLELAQVVLSRLRDAGVQIALDDFGTGYSSIYHLRNFRFDKIKIDRSYVDALGGEDPENDAIVRAMLGLGQGLGLTIIAEGVENAEQRDCLIRKGCEQGQGFLFGKALSAKDVATLLADADPLRKIASL